MLITNNAIGNVGLPVPLLSFSLVIVAKNGSIYRRWDPTRGLYTHTHTYLYIGV